MTKERETKDTAAEDCSAAALDRTRRRKRRRRLVRKLIVWTLLLAVLGIAGWILRNKLRSDYRVVYDEYPASVGTISNALNYSGAVQLIDSKNYTAPSATKVQQVFVARNEKVSKGDKLIRLRDGTTLTADFEGTVSTLAVQAGDEVGAGDTLLKLVDYDHMRISIRISAADIGEVTEGTACRVTVPLAGVTLRSRIGEIDFSTYSGNNTVYYTSTVDVDLSGAEGVKPGMPATVTVTREEAADVVVLSVNAISTAPDNTAFVYKEAEDGTMVPCPVTLGVSNGNYVEIREGVSAGETVCAVAKKDESATGWSALFQSAFGSQQVNRNSYGGGQGGWNGGGNTNTNRNPGTNRTRPSGGGN